ncbi:MAG TPA: pirin family protein [Usitatibacter sp.]|nr:pirin family protein [Usitatibacter sp.]
MNTVVDQAVRAVERVVKSQVAPVGTFTVRRALPDRERHSVGPWVFLDHFGPMRIKPGHDGVGPHPHAGIETVTYLLSGRNQHRDSAGHTGIVSKGGAQWMTSGRGIIHAERPLAEDDSELTLHGIQLWTSLPRAHKQMAPRYQRLDAGSIPQSINQGTTLRVVAGELAGVRGPAEALMPLVLAHLTLEPGASFEAAAADGFEIAAYVIAGEGQFGAPATRAGLGELALFDGASGAIRIANTSSAALEVMMLGGAPAEGPLVFHGPFVMNNVEQVRAAEIAYRTGRMGTLEE